MTELVFVNEKSGRRYRVIKFNKEAGTVTMVGPHGLEIEERYSREKFENLGYKLQAA